jgi:leucine dehydrogenase
MEKNNCNELHIQHDKESGCVFIIAMNTIFGDKGNGGTRMKEYPSTIAGIEAATRLVNVMTKKCVIIGKKYNGGYSGGKGVIIGDPKTQKSPAMLRRYGRFVQSLKGRFQTGTDMNINIKDINHMAEESEFVDGLESGLGDTAIPTAYGTIVAMKTLCKWKYGSDSLKDKVVTVQGVGSVGRDLVKRLVEEDARVIATDTNKAALQEVKKSFNIETVAPDEIYGLDCDIFSPNACGGILTKENIKRLKCDMVIGAANNPLADELESVQAMKKKDIVYAPDYVINIGGVFLSMCEVQGKDFDYVIETTEEIIQKRLKQVIAGAKKASTTLYEAAEALVQAEMDCELKKAKK